MRLIDADALMECIRTNHYRLTIAGLNSTDYGMFTDGIQQAVDAQPTVGEWISVKAKLPPSVTCRNRNEYEPVMLYAPKDGSVYIGWYFGKDYRGVNQFICRTSMNAYQYITKKITHWMQMPEPPKE